MAKRIGANRRKLESEQRARRPRRMKIIGKIMGIAILVCVAGFAVYKCSPAAFGKIVSIFKSDGKAAAGFKIVNCSSMVEGRLASALLDLAAADSHKVDRAVIMKAAVSVPEIQKISIGKTKDKAALIKVTERKPVAIVHDGNICLVDKNGIRFDASPGQYYDLPLVSFARSSSDTLDLSIFNMIKNTSQNIGTNFFQQISQIDLSDKKSVNLIFKSGKTEYTINPEDIENRLAHVKKLVERLQDGNEEPAHIDLRYRNLAFSTM
jgi:cell division septal protein FtsQ